MNWQNISVTRDEYPADPGNSGLRASGSSPTITSHASVTGFNPVATLGAELRPFQASQSGAHFFFQGELAKSWLKTNAHFSETDPVLLGIRVGYRF